MPGLKLGDCKSGEPKGLAPAGELKPKLLVEKPVASALGMPRTEPGPGRGCLYSNLRLEPERPAAMDSPPEPKPALPGPVPGKPAFGESPAVPLMPGMLSSGSSRTGAPLAARNWSAALSSVGVGPALSGL